ncbi:MAG: glycosyltransferase [Porticoccaceae bacterium]
MRILISADPFLPVPPRLYGGIERVIDGLVQGLRAAGDEVALLAHAESTCAVSQRFAWREVQPQSPGQHLRCIVDFRRAVGEFRPDLVHSFSRLAYLLSRSPRGLPKLMSYQRAPSPRTVTWSSRLAGRSLQFTGCSEYIAGLGRCAGGNWSALPNFIDPEVMRFVPAVAPDAPLLFLSRVESIKGADTAIAIARGSGRRLVIAGNAPEHGAEADWFQREVLPSIDGEQVRYVGAVDDTQKNALLGAAAAMLVPIRWDEPFGIVFAESLACGTPVISCPRGALPEIVETGRHGFLVQDVTEGIAAVARIGEIDRAQCRARALSHFSAAAVVPQYRRLYQSVIAGTHGDGCSPDVAQRNPG